MEEARESVFQEIPHVDINRQRHGELLSFWNFDLQILQRMPQVGAIQENVEIRFIQFQTEIIGIIIEQINLEGSAAEGEVFQ